MKSLHRADLFSWSVFDAARDVDFHGFCWARPEGNVLIDPLPMSRHDRAHLERLGGAAWIVITNSDHTRAANEIASWTGARIAGPAAERASFPFPCDRWLGEGDALVPGLRVHALDGSKTPGELAFRFASDGAAGDTLLFGDLVRAHRAGVLHLLPDAKLSDRGAALASVRRVAEVGPVSTVLVGDGWHAFGTGEPLLAALLR
jgi:hypothetical protein